MKAILALAFLGVMASCGHATKFVVLIEETMGLNGKVIVTLNNKFNGVSSVASDWTRDGNKFRTSVSFDASEAYCADIDRVQMEYEESGRYSPSVTVSDENNKSRKFGSRFTSLQEIKEDAQIPQSAGGEVKHILRLTEGKMIRKFLVYVRGLPAEEATTYVTLYDNVVARTNEIYLPKELPKENKPWFKEEYVDDGFDVDTIDKVTLTRLVKKNLDNGNLEDKKCTAKVCIYDFNSGKCRIYKGSSNWDIYNNDGYDDVENTVTLQKTGKTQNGTLKDCLAKFDSE